jgi:hypothetical protein
MIFVNITPLQDIRKHHPLTGYSRTSPTYRIFVSITPYRIYVNITHFQDIREHHQLSGYSVRG